MCGVIHSNNFCYLWRFFHFLIHTPFLTKARGLDPSLRLSQLPDCYCRWVTAEALGRHRAVNLSLPPFQHRPPTPRLRDHDTCSDNNWHLWSEKEGQMAKGMIDDIAAIEKRERCGARVRSNTSIWRMEPDQSRSETKDKEGQKHTKPKQAKGSTEKSFSFHLHSSKLVKLLGVFLIFSHRGEWLHCGECKKNLTALFTWKICYTFDLYSLTAKGMDWSQNFPSEKLSLDMHLRAEENLAILYPPSLLLDPSLKLGSAGHRLRWTNIFTGFSLFYFSDFHFCLTFYIQTVSSHSLFVSRPKESFDLFAFQPSAANFALRLVWIEKPTSRTASTKYSRALTTSP